MNKTELTAAIYCAYWGSRVAIYSNTAPKKLIVSEIMTVGTNGMYDIATVRLEDKSTFPVALSECKLLLNPLSEKSLTPEQRKELTKIYYQNTDEFEDDTDMFLIENITFNLFDSIGNAAACLNYLRSISVDCDGLLKSGIAKPIE